MPTCRQRSSHDPRRRLDTRSCRVGSQPVRLVMLDASRRVSSASPRRQDPQWPAAHPDSMKTSSASRRSGSASPRTPRPAHDAITALFSSSPGGAARTHMRPAASSTSRSAKRPGGQRSHARTRPHRPPTARRRRAVAAVAAAALLVAFVAPGAFTDAPESATDQTRQDAGRRHVTLAARQPSRPQREAARRQRARQRRGHPAETVQQTDDVRRHRARASRGDLGSPARPRSSRRTRRTPDVTAPPRPPQPIPASRQVTPPTPLSSACDEFPPC